MPRILLMALGFDLSPLRPWEWDGVDADWWQELLDAKNAYTAGHNATVAERKASERSRAWARDEAKRIYGSGAG